MILFLQSNTFTLTSVNYLFCFLFLNLFNFEQAILGSHKSTKTIILTENVFNKLIEIISSDQFEITQKVRELIDLFLENSKYFLIKYK